MTIERMQASALILAGGQSSRMGCEKGLIKLSGKNLAEYVSETVKPLFVETILVSNAPEKFSFLNIRTVTDVKPGLGPLVGLYSGLLASSSDLNFLVSYDMPFISGKAIALLFDHAKKAEAVVPMIDGRLQPMFAVYNKKCISIIEGLIDSGRLAMHQLLDKLELQIIGEEAFIAIHEVPGNLIFSVNSEDDIAQAENILRGQSRDE